MRCQFGETHRPSCAIIWYLCIFIGEWIGRYHIFIRSHYYVWINTIGIAWIYVVGHLCPTDLPHTAHLTRHGIDMAASLASYTRSTCPTTNSRFIRKMNGLFFTFFRRRAELKMAFVCPFDVNKTIVIMNYYNKSFAMENSCCDNTNKTLSFPARYRRTELK